jgi:catechol 2,3-dioxygenase-like lactoylglutathione lyase family enzyme
MTRSETNFFATLPDPAGGAGGTAHRQSKNKEIDMGVRLAHVCFETDDLDKTEAFYNILGIKKRFEFRNLQDELVGYYLAFDNQTYIEVIKTATLAKPGLIRHFAIEVDSVDEAYDALKSGGIDVTEKTLAGDHNWMITCHDPSGIFIELQEYTDRSMQIVGGRCEVDYRPDQDHRPI